MTWSKESENVDVACSDHAHPPNEFVAPAVEEIWDELGEDTREKVIVKDKTIYLHRPRESDRLLDHPAVHAAFAKDEYMPYWADIWPASRMLAKAIMDEGFAGTTHAFEIGCGLGLAGIAALSRGLHVTFSDYDPCALRYAAENARGNGYSNFDVMQMDWRQPPEGMQVSLLLAADLVYELRNVAPLVDLIKTILAPDGLCLLTDQDRVAAENLRETLQNAGLTFTTKMMRAGEPGGRRTKGTLYRIRKTPLAS